MSSSTEAVPHRGVRLSDQGGFWLGAEDHCGDAEVGVSGGQMFVDYQIPETQTRALPVILIHGGGGQGVDWMTTPDGRPGWRTLLLQRGYAVYTVDRPGHGRSPGRAEAPASVPGELLDLPRLFAGANNPEHTQWPGTGLPDDPALAQLVASQVPLPELSTDHELMRKRGSELLDRVGPAIVITSSAGGPSGWLMGDARPDLVKAIVALEPLGPGGAMELPWGLAAARLTYEPAAAMAEELERVSVAVDGQPPARLQAEPARQLPHLRDIPIAIVTGEHSFAGPMDAATVAYLRQAGCRRVEHLPLADLGIHGNGHLMMLERNNAQVLDAVLAWVEARVDGGVA